MYKLVLRWWFVSLLLFISACGWQLRGTQGYSGSTPSADLPNNIYLQARTHNSKMSKVLQDIFSSKDMTLSADAPVTLILDDEALDKRPLSVTQTGVTAQYQLTLTVRYHYQTRDDNDAPIEHSNRKVSSWRSYDFDAKLIVAKNQEEQSLLHEMRKELAYRILNDVPES